MEDLPIIISAIITVVIIVLGIEAWKAIELRKEVDSYKRSISYLEDRIAYRDREGERNFKDLVAGIDGVTSVSLSSKRYVELLRAENDLVELKLKVKEVGNG